MKIKLLGVLILLLFLQSTATKAFALKSEAHPFYSIQIQHLQSHPQNNAALIFDNLALEIEDEDEFSEIENNTNQEALISSIPISSPPLLLQEQGLILNGQGPYSAYSKKSIYILWSVFRI